MLLLHITIAILSLIWATITVFKPSVTKLRASYGMTAGVVVTGILLVVANHAVMLQACSSGLTYLVVSFSLAVVARRKLVRQLTN
jgi:hypothetical protein